MGYRGKVVEQERARALRAEAWTLQEIADELGVAKSSVSLWVRDVAFVPRPRQPGPNRRPHPSIARKEAEIAELPRAPTERSWDWWRRCYRQKPFRGSSVGRALGC